MRIAYWTIDDVNLSVARDLAEVHDATIDQVMGWEKGTTQDPDAILCDLDFLPPGMREEILSRLILAPLPLPVAVHSYNLEDAQIELLVAQGVAVCRRLESEVFGNLRSASRPARHVAYTKDGKKVTASELTINKRMMDSNRTRRKTCSEYSGSGTARPTGL
jgi:hypothetical protein